MARWLQSAGLQHLASPLASADQKLLPNMGYGAQSAEEKQKLFKLLRNLNFNGEAASEPYTPTSQSVTASGATDGFYSPDLRGEFGAGLLDLHVVDDTELLSEHVMTEPFEPSPFMPTRDFDDDFDAMYGRQGGGIDDNCRAPVSEKEIGAKESNVAKIKVVVNYLMDEAKDKSDKQIDVMSWKQETISNLPLQEKGYDCGMFMLKYIDCHSRGLNLTFGQKHMTYFGKEDREGDSEAERAA